jgi:serine protease Do
MLSLSLLLALSGTPLEDLVAKVDGSVVTVRVGIRYQSETDTQAVVGLSISTGSGVLVHAQGGAGYVVTASHVVEEADAIQVFWKDGFKADATIISLSRTEDLALLKVAALPDRPVVARLGDAEALRPGQRLFAIGAPYGLEHSTTAGIVSALRVNTRRGLNPSRLLQTDVAINQGNSGGPLFNEAGEVVGIASFILSRSGGSVGLNFAVPANTVRLRLFEQPLPWLGVSLRHIPKDVAEIFNWPVESGFLVEKVRPGSAAAEGGLKAGGVESVVGGNEVLLGGDLITRVNGVDTASTDRIAQALRGLKAGDVIHYEVLRAGHPQNIDVTIPEGLTIPRLPAAATGR